MKIKKWDAYLWDCLDIMDNLIEQWIQVDAIITDPPYWTTACKWDQIIPFDKMRERLNKLIKPNWAIVLFWSEPFSSALRMSNIKNYKYDWIWQKNNAWNFQIVKYQPLKKHEIITIFSNKSHNYYPQWLTECNKILSNKWKAWSLWHLWSEKLRENYTQKVTWYPNANLFFDRPVKPLHPTQKPVALIEYLVKTYTNEWGTVLDFTAGSFTTAIACENTNRKRICIEKDEWYYNIWIERVNRDTK